MTPAARGARPDHLRHRRERAAGAPSSWSRRVSAGLSPRRAAPRATRPRTPLTAGAGTAGWM